MGARRGTPVPVPSSESGTSNVPIATRSRLSNAPLENGQPTATNPSRRPTPTSPGANLDVVELKCGGPSMLTFMGNSTDLLSRELLMTKETDENDRTLTEGASLQYRIGTPTYGTEGAQMGSGNETTSGEPLSVAVVVPTRNEAGNIEEFVKRATLAMQDRDVRWEVVFADDSDDDTPAVIEDLAQTGKPLRCVHRPPDQRRESIGGAVKAAVAEIDADFVVVIDADLQHPPEILPALIGPLWFNSADFVIGTRYGPGGSAEGLGSTWRRSASRSSAMFAKLLFPEYRRCSDLASGLFAFRRTDFEMTSDYATGFKVLAEALARCQPRRIAEVPYTFEERTDGLSKARIADGLTHIKVMLRLRWMTSASRSVAVERREVPFSPSTSP